MTTDQLVTLMVTAVVLALAALTAALSAFNRDRAGTGAALLALAFASAGLLLALGFWPAEEPAGCLFMQPRWVDGVETTRCVPGGQR